MADKEMMDVLDTLVGFIVQGYVRSECAQEFMIEDVIKLIINFDGGCKNCSLHSLSGSLSVSYFNKRCEAPIFSAFDVSNYGRSTLVLDLFGNVWDCNYIGEQDKGCIQVPKKLKLKQRIIAISVGTSHSLLLTIDGHVQSLGTSGCGALGHGDVNVLIMPTTIETLENYQIVQISTGRLHSAALTDDGQLFLWGFNGSSQCGASDVFHVSTPTKLEFDKKVSYIACGNDHNLLITEDHLVYSFGEDCVDDLQSTAHPVLIKALSKKKIIKCAAGRYHSLCIDEEGTIWSFGRNDHGQLGLGHNKFEGTPQIIEWFVQNNIRAYKCAAGGDRSAIISAVDNLYIFGGITYVVQNNNPQKVSSFPKDHMMVRKISIRQDANERFSHAPLIC